MRSYDSPGDVVTIFIPEDQREFYGAADENFEQGALRGVTEGPADPETGLLNIAVTGVFSRAVQNNEAYDLQAGSPVWIIGPDTLGYPAEPSGDPPFAYLVDIAPPGTNTIRVRLMG